MRDAKKALSRGSKMSVTSWFLVSSSGTRHRLPPEMIFVGREECELMLQSRSVDKQHAVVNYDPSTDEHMVKDLGSLNGTFVNDLRIPDQTYITLKLSDVIRFGYDSHVYILERSQHKVPEEALKHEKYTSQLQMSMKALEARKREKERLHAERTKDSFRTKQEKPENKALLSTVMAEAPVSRPTPLYGQPSWWGDDDAELRAAQRPDDDHAEAGKDVFRQEVTGPLSDSKSRSIFSYRKEPSYFEIPTKESQPQTLNEDPTKDSDPREVPALPTTTLTPTPPVVQSHASFTIEFDECMPGKMKIKDHVTKFSFRQPRKLPGKEAAMTTPTEVMSAENKVADWLVQSDMNRRRSRTEDMYGDLPDHNRTSACHRHENDSNPGDPVVNGRQVLQSEPPMGPHTSLPPELSPSIPFTPPESSEPLSSSPPESRSPVQSQGKADLKQAFVIEFFDDSPRRIRSQSFNTVPPDSPDLKHKLEKISGPGTPTQQYTVPLKDSGSGPLRAGSLRREKTEDRISTGFSSRSASVTPRPFRSVGRRSKLAQDFKTEFLRVSGQESKPSMNTTWERSSSGSPTASPPPTVVAAVSQQTPPSPPPPPVPYLAQTSSPVHQTVALKAPVMPVALPPHEPPPPTEVGTPKGLGNEEDDTLSEAGTYTIETEVQDKEVEEARSKINQVFGVEGPEEPSQTTAAAYKPIKAQDREEHRQSSSVDLRPAPGQGLSLVQVPGGSKWVSRWASLADSYTDSSLASHFYNIPSQMELSEVGGRVAHQEKLSRNINPVDVECRGSRTRRILPQAPSMEKNDASAPTNPVHQDRYSTYDLRERSSRAPHPDKDHLKLAVQNDLDPDSLSESDDCSVVEHRKTPTPERTDGSSTRSREDERPSFAAKSTSFYIGSEETVSKPGRTSVPNTPKAERKQPPSSKTPQFSTATLTKQWVGPDSQKAVKPNSSVPNLECQVKVIPQPKELSVSLVRQESFTKDRPSDAAQVTKLPHISSQPLMSYTEPAEAFQAVDSHDTHSYLQETADALSALEAKLQAQPPDGAAPPIHDSLSGESDMDSASTASQRSNRITPATGFKKPSVTSGLQRERSSVQEPSRQPSTRSSTSEKPQFQGSGSNRELGRRLGIRRSVGKPGPVDLGDDLQSSSSPRWPDTASSDQELSRPAADKNTVQKEDPSKSSRVAQALSRSNSMSAPRPTRASMLRRARLGDASDTEATEPDRTSQNSQEANGTARASQDSKKQLSRLDMLAMPRKRTSSFTTPSDTESPAPRTGFSNRSTESSGGSGRKASTAVPISKPALGRDPTKPIPRGHSSSLKYTSSTASSRRRQKGSDYTSTSEEEYDSGNQTAPKHKRSHTPSASRSQPLIPLRPKPRPRDSDQESHEGDAYQSWSSHSAEIAREIHDVAGDADPQSSNGVEANSSTKTTQEELVHSVPEAGVNFQRVHNGSATGRPPDQMMNNQEHKSMHGGWNQEEDSVDGLMLTPLSQISLAIRENTEQLAEKIKVLFHNKADIWEEIEAKLSADNDMPILKSSNKEISSILKELRRVQKQLEVINTIIEPSVYLETPEACTPRAPSSAGVKPSRAPSRNWSSSSSQRGGGPPASSRPSESIKRLAMSSETESYVV
ncbi:centrosomal protein of 170 kDa protein B isoform X3 [Esox lucius]|uniref:centrosomal protein of 170 kDa protein B isoform X3 n=1 Tax=Esox lucius TaxID=8010 RepID=UPI0014778470|nr:centrosomal protein of 170 kDa protein B isoform X3 [Esox lucius]